MAGVLLSDKHSVMWYIFTYIFAFSSSRRIFRDIGCSRYSALRLSIKAANLACCFAGFAKRDDGELRQKVANLGIMSAMYDLVSDRSCSEPQISAKAKEYQARLLSSRSSLVLDDLLSRKRARQVGHYGLDRGVDALMIINLELAGQADADEKRTIFLGRVSQVMDDLIDWRSDSKSDHLNYLKHQDAIEVTQEFLSFDYVLEYGRNPRSWILRYAFRRARRIAARIIAEDESRSSRRQLGPPQIGQTTIP